MHAGFWTDPNFSLRGGFTAKTISTTSMYLESKNHHNFAQVARRVFYGI